jgi:hypothetical protein
MSENRNPVDRRTSTAACALRLLGAAALLGAACSAPERTVVTRTVVEETIAAPATTDILISDLREVPAGDPSKEKVFGTIVNRGDKAVSQLSIRVDALDSAGRVVESITTPPLKQTIAALGGQATFEASIPRNPAIISYHAVAIAR